MLLLFAAAEDIRRHKVSNRITGAVCLLGAARVCIKSEDRWETVLLTCLFLCLLFVLYFGVLCLGRKMRRKLCFGGADVKLIAGAMLFFGWEKALWGMLFGLLAAAAAYAFQKAAGLIAGSGKNPRGTGTIPVAAKTKRTEIPLVPWLACGMLAVAFAL